MTGGTRIAAFTAIAGCIVVAAGVYVGVDLGRAAERADRAPELAVTTLPAIQGAPHVVFRNTEVGSAYGLVSMVALADPQGPRATTTAACDRVYAAAGTASCLRTKRGIATTFEAQQLDARWRLVRSWALPGTPSRTRVSADGSLIASTVFVAGHSYLQVGFSTATDIRSASGHDFGNLEKFALVIAGDRVSPTDRNIWGVTFAADDNTFYATAATGGTTYLVRGDLRARTLTAIHAVAECPSLAPDGKHIAYKKNAGGTTPHWSIAVLDLATGRETVLAGEKHSVDDQVEWLDDDTVLYGLARSNAAGVSDVWSIDVAAGARPELFIGHAWSPSVVRN